jgi:hypothetical protein
MIAKALGVELDTVKQSMDAIVTDVDRVAPYGEAKAEPEDFRQ